MLAAAPRMLETLLAALLATTDLAPGAVPFAGLPGDSLASIAPLPALSVSPFV